MSDTEPEPETQTATERPTVVLKPGIFVTAVILGCFAMGGAIYWLLRSMHI